jgi:hypothetical protein
MAVRPIADTLRDVRGGVVLDELAENMQALVNAVTDTGKAGKLTLVIEVKPFEKADGAVVVRDTIKLTLPKITSQGSVMFATPEGNLQRNHPKQDELPGLRDVKEKEA